jgi:hypothetical protein
MAALTSVSARIWRSCGGALCVGLTIALLAACALPRDQTYPEGSDGRGGYSGDEGQGLFGSSGLLLFGGKKDLKYEPGAGGGGIGVNSYLWRASLDTISFMPLTSADPFGGVIITDWYSPPEAPNERFKMAVYILDRRLRADGLRVAVFRQLRDGSREWADVAVNDGTKIKLENAILTRARQLRIAAVPQ